MCSLAFASGLLFSITWGVLGFPSVSVVCGSEFLSGNPWPSYWQAVCCAGTWVLSQETPQCVIADLGSRKPRSHRDVSLQPGKDESAIMK